MLPNVGVRPFLVHRSWSVSSRTSRPSAWTNVAAFARLDTHFDPRARRAPSVECASPRSLPVQSTSRRQLLDGVFNEMIAILHRHAPNDVTVAADSLLGGLQRVTKHELLGMVLGEITDGLHQPQHAKVSATHALLPIVSCASVRISSGRIGKRTLHLCRA